MKYYLLIVALFLMPYPVKAADQDALLKIVHSLPENTFVKVTLKDGTVIIGQYENYIEYDDSFFIQPFGSHGLFSDEAFGLNEISDIRRITSFKYKAL